jgi:hypothetical protein
MGLAVWPVAPDGCEVDAAGADVGDDDETLPPDDPHAASNSAADAASATMPKGVARLTRVARVARVPVCMVDRIILIVRLQYS